MKTPYNLSKNYEQLYKLICEGLVAACFVDYSYSGDDIPSRDIAKCRKYDERISVGVRGCEYGSVSRYDQLRTGETEKELFIKECERMNLEWINNQIKVNDKILVLGGGKSLMVEMIQHKNGITGVLSSITKDNLPEEYLKHLPALDDKNIIVVVPGEPFKRNEAIERLKEMPIPILSRKTGTLHFEEPKHNHKRKPSKYKSK